jgi:hypothetical protein
MRHDSRKGSASRAGHLRHTNTAHPTKFLYLCLLYIASQRLVQHAGMQLPVLQCHGSITTTSYACSSSILATTSSKAQRSAGAFPRVSSLRCTRCIICTVLNTDDHSPVEYQAPFLVDDAHLIEGDCKCTIYNLISARGSVLEGQPSQAAAAT